MDGWFAWQILKGVIAFGAMVLAAASVLVIWRMRGVLSWKRSLRDEMKELNRLETACEARRQATEVVAERCRRLWHAVSPDPRELTELSGYIRSIAICYHPDAERPEMQITTGYLLKSARRFAGRLEMILHRPGFKRLGRVRIRHIRQSYEWYGRVNQYWIYRCLNRYWNVIRRLFQLHLVILPDPFSWLAYLSNRLTVLVLTRCLLMDVYLFVGKLAIDAYDEEENAESVSTETDALEEILEELDALNPAEPDITDPRILEIRNRLVSVAATVVSTPGLQEWKNAVRETADVIAAKYFPDSPCPLEEAALGPLLARSRVWLQSVCETEKYPLVSRFYRIKIESLYSVKAFTDGMLSKQMRTYAKKAWDLYQWMKWPLKVYRGIKRVSPVWIAVDVGWLVTRKSFVNFICRQTFDTAHRELEMIYSDSRMEKSE